MKKRSQEDTTTTNLPPNFQIFLFANANISVVFLNINRIVQQAPRCLLIRFFSVCVGGQCVLDSSHCCQNWQLDLSISVKPNSEGPRAKGWSPAPTRKEGHGTGAGAEALSVE